MTMALWGNYGLNNALSVPATLLEDQHKSAYQQKNTQQEASDFRMFSNKNTHYYRFH